MTKETGYDKRPRFGYTPDLDKNPMQVYEEYAEDEHPVVVIPLPKITRKIQTLVRKLIGQRGGRGKGPIWV